MPLNMHLSINLHNILVTLHRLLDAAFVTSLLHLFIFSRVPYTDTNFNRRLKNIFVFGICLIIYAAAMGRIGNQIRSYTKARKAWEKAKEDTVRAKKAWRKVKCVALSAKARAEAAEREAGDAEARARAAERDTDDAITRLQGERGMPNYQRLLDENAQLREYVGQIVAWAAAWAAAHAANADNEN